METVCGSTTHTLLSLGIVNVIISNILLGYYFIKQCKNNNDSKHKKTATIYLHGTINPNKDNIFITRSNSESSDSSVEESSGGLIIDDSSTEDFSGENYEESNDSKDDELINDERNSKTGNILENIDEVLDVLAEASVKLSENVNDKDKANVIITDLVSQLMYDNTLDLDDLDKEDLSKLINDVLAKLFNKVEDKLSAQHIDIEEETHTKSETDEESSSNSLILSGSSEEDVSGEGYKELNVSTDEDLINAVRVIKKFQIDTRTKNTNKSDKDEKTKGEKTKGEKNKLENTVSHLISCLMNDISENKDGLVDTLSDVSNKITDTINYDIISNIVCEIADDMPNLDDDLDQLEQDKVSNLTKEILNKMVNKLSTEQTDIDENKSEKQIDESEFLMKTLEDLKNPPSNIGDWKLDDEYQMIYRSIRTKSHKDLIKEHQEKESSDDV